MASFADFTAASASLPTWNMTVSTDLATTAEIERLRVEQAELLEVAEAAKDAGPQRARKAGQGVDPAVKACNERLAEIETQLKELEERRAASQATLTLCVIPIGEWMRFVQANQAADGNVLDHVIGLGLASAEAMITNLGLFVVGWNGETLRRGTWTDDGLQPGDWTEAHTAKIPPAEAQAAGRSILQHHQTPVIIPKSLSRSASTGSSASA